MLRATALALACLVLLACPGPPHPKPVEADETAVRIEIARAEAQRGGGLAVLAERARSAVWWERALALRALGRIGGARAHELLREALADAHPEVIAAAAGGIGVAASLDDETVDDKTTFVLAATVARAGKRAPVVIEAIGRASGVSSQPSLVELLLGDGAGDVAAAAGIALGRHGRRKIAFSPAVRTALVTATTHPDARVRYAATWALAREHEPPQGTADDVALASKLLAVATGDPEPEIRAQAVAALGRRKLVRAAGATLENALIDRDWRVAVEAVRALGGESGSEGGRDAVAVALARRFVDLERGNETEAHVVIEGLRALAPHPKSRIAIEAIAEVGKAARSSTAAPLLARDWIDCLAYVNFARHINLLARDASVCSERGLPDHLRLPLLSELVTAAASTVAERRELLRQLLAHGDPRVRAAGITALPAMWKDGDEADHKAAIATIVAALASSDPMIAGSAVEAAPAIYTAIGTGDHAALDDAIVTRARSESDAELAASLFDLIAKQKLAAGVDACRDALGKHPVVARAASKCLVALGTTGDPAGVAPAPRPPGIDVATVIGKTVRWRIATSRGELAIRLRPDVAPWAVATIVVLTQRGYYDNLEFHRVVPNFVVQGGDPTQSGWGGPGFVIPAEPHTSADGTGFVVGGVGIADAGRDSGGSQWFAMHGRAPHLDGRYTWIGSIESGQKSADALLIGDRVVKATIELGQN